MLTGRPALISAAKRVTVGEHLCIIYDDREDQLATVAPFIQSGIKRGERCLYIIDENTAQEVVAGMRRASVDVDAAISAGALMITDRRDAYLRGGIFDPEAMLRYWGDAIVLAKADGFAAVRVIGEMTWALGGEPGVERLLEYEAKLDRFMASRDILALCHYNRRRFSPRIIRGVLNTHPNVIFGGLVCANPYYVHPDEFLHPDEHAEINRLLRTLVDHQRAEDELDAGREQLQLLARRLVAIQESERREIAREVHDEFGQTLTAVSLILEEIALSVPATMKHRLRDAEALITDLMRRLSELSLRLRPATLDQFGLVPTLRWYVDHYQKQTRVRVNLQIDAIEGIRFPSEVETAAYRIIQEALTNVARHARVRQAIVRLWTEDTVLRVRVEDRGKGFDPDAAGGAGLVGMRERAMALGGALNVTASSEGVIVTAMLPFADQPDENRPVSGV